MLEIQNIFKSFDGVEAVKDFSARLEEGKITSLIGPNGAGKSTVFNILTGFLSANSGSASYNNIPLLDLSPWKITRLGISRTFQNLRLFKKLTVLENVMLGRQGQNGEKFLNALFAFSENSKEHKANLERSLSLIEFAGLTNEKNAYAENLSYGQQKLLSIACALATEPKFLLLDEPVSGIQPAMIQKIFSILKELVERQGKTIFLIEHDIDFVLRISDTVVVMDEGKKMAECPPSAIQNNSEILEAYLS